VLVPSARELYREGRLEAAIAQLGVELRDAPTDTVRRTFLFELLCFTGDLGRARKQLDVLRRTDEQAARAAVLYDAALRAEEVRRRAFAGEPPPAVATTGHVSGTLNGTPFRSIRDADPRVGEHLEVFAGQEYVWLPFGSITRLTAGQPTRLRDLLWIEVDVTTRSEERDLPLGPVLVPAMTPGAWSHASEAVRLGRETRWERLADGREAPVGQRLWVVDDVEVPILEVRELRIDHAPPTPEAPFIVQ
jgi:type VI secretion system protein ImpE